MIGTIENWCLRLTWFFFALSLANCATDPGSSAPVAGSAIVFTYANPDFEILTSRVGFDLTTGIILMGMEGTNRKQATEIEADASVTFPDSLRLSVATRNCSGTLIGSSIG